MFYLKNIYDGNLFYFKEDKNEFFVGRKDCDFLIADDNSISRRHAKITIDNEKITIIDLGSRYNTFVNKEKIEAQEEIAVKAGDEVKFGIKKSAYRLEELKLIVCCSNLASSEKTTLTQALASLKGKLVQNWSSACNFLVVKEIVLTIKTLCAITHGQAIVKTSFFTDLLQNVNENKPMPDFKSYKPPLNEKILSQNIDISYTPKRKTLFANKVFIFPTETIRKKFEEMVELAGGKAVGMDKTLISKKHIDSEEPQYIFMQFSDQLMNKNGENLLKYLNEKGQRTIPVNEIAMAIIKCSMQKDCNPYFNRTLNLIQGKSNLASSCGKVLALETQGTSHSAGDNVQIDSLELASIPDSQISSDFAPSSHSSMLLPNTDSEQNNISAVVVTQEDKNISVNSKEVVKKRKADAEVLPSTSSKKRQIEIENNPVIDLIEDGVSSSSQMAPVQSPEKNKISTKITAIDEESSQESVSSSVSQNHQTSSFVRKGTHEVDGPSPFTMKAPLTTAPKASKKQNPFTAIFASKRKAEDCVDSDSAKKTPRDYSQTSSLESQSQSSFTAATTAKKTDNPFSRRSPLSKGNTNTQNPLSKTSSSSTITQNPFTFKRTKSASSNQEEIEQKKQKLVENPFSKNAIRSKSCSSESSVFLNETSSQNNSNNKKGDNGNETANNSVFMSTFIHKKQPFNPNISTITVIDTSNTPWISTTGLKDKQKEDESMKYVDKEMSDFIESFKGTMVVSEVEIKPKAKNTTTVETTYDGKVNYKKFKKVKPCFPQTSILPRASFNKFIFNADDIPLGPDPNADSEEETERLIVKPIKKKQGRVFKF